MSYQVSNSSSSRPIQTQFSHTTQSDQVKNSQGGGYNFIQGHEIGSPLQILQSHTINSDQLMQTQHYNVVGSSNMKNRAH